MQRVHLHDSGAVGATGARPSAAVVLQVEHATAVLHKAVSKCGIQLVQPRAGEQQQFDGRLEFCLCAEVVMHAVQQAEEEVDEEDCFCIRFCIGFVVASLAVTVITVLLVLYTNVGQACG